MTAESAEFHFAADLAQNRVPSARRIKAELHVGQDRAAAHSQDIRRCMQHGGQGIGGAHHADRVMVGGRWVVEDGAIPGVDMPALIKRHGAASRVLATA